MANRAILSGNWVAIRLGGPIRVLETSNIALVAARVVEKSILPDKSWFVVRD